MAELDTSTESCAIENKPLTRINQVKQDLFAICEFLHISPIYKSGYFTKYDFNIMIPRFLLDKTYFFREMNDLFVEVALFSIMFLLLNPYKDEGSDEEEEEGFEGGSIQSKRRTTPLLMASPHLPTVRRSDTHTYLYVDLSNIRNSMRYETYNPYNCKAKDFIEDVIYVHPDQRTIAIFLGTILGERFDFMEKEYVSD